MAVNDPNVVLDPAIVKWGRMHANRYKYFRWTKRTAGITFMYMVVVPAFFGYLGYTTDGLYDMKGKRREDIIKER